MKPTHVNPKGLIVGGTFTQVVVTEPGRLAFIAGQVAYDENRKIVGEGDLYLQSLQVLRNLRIALDAVGAAPADLVSSTVYIVGLDIARRDAFSKAMKDGIDGRPFPANASTWVGVTSLASPGLLIEVSAIARLPDSHAA